MENLGAWAVKKGAYRQTLAINLVQLKTFLAGLPGSRGKSSKIRLIDAGLAPNGYGLELKMAAAEKCGGADKLARGQVLGREIGPVDTVKFVEE